MKLSFSTRGWQQLSWDELVNAACEMRFQGIEVYNIEADSSLTDRGGPFHKYNCASTVRALRDSGISIVCFDTNFDISVKDDTAIDSLRSVMEISASTGVSYVSLCAKIGNIETVRENIACLLKDAEKLGITLLIKTTGMFSNTEALRDLLNYFASDFTAVLWDMHKTYRVGGESAATTITNLGSYVRHVHIRDSNDDGSYDLIGEGSLPIEEMVDALASINYDGFVSLEWKPEWMDDLQDINIIFPHFVNFMSRFESPRLNRTHLYDNNAHTGKYVWKKDSLIDETFGGVLDRMAGEFPDQTAVKFTTLNYTRTYYEFREDVDECARALIAAGVKAGTHVAMWATNLPQWYIAFWATVKIGAVLVTVNTAYKIYELEYLLRQSDTHTLIMEQGYKGLDYAAIVNELCPELANTKKGDRLHCHRLPFLRNVITVGFKQKGSLSWDEFIAAGESVSPEEVRRMAANVSPYDVCNMQYTSGTTGFPKGVMLTHYNVVNNGKCIGDRMDLSTADRMMIQVPMFHCFGMVLAMTAAMTHGATILPLPYFSPKPALNCIHQERITAFHGVPTMFIALLEHPDFEKTDFSHMRTGIMAGSPCPIAVMQEVVTKMNMREITIVYGQTESSPGCTMSSTDDPLDVRVGTVGRALPEIECRIVDPETNQELPVGQIGEFVARGYNVMKGYYKMPEATRSTIDKDGWLHTGDLACKTEDGNYRITGRLKDMIIRGGENIYPKEIEEFIYTCDKVKDVQVIGVPDEQYGEEVMACVILKDGETMTEDEMKAYISANMAKHKVPKYISFVNEFPMNAAGKILKYKMREEAVDKLKLQNAANIVTA